MELFTPEHKNHTGLCIQCGESKYLEESLDFVCLKCRLENLDTEASKQFFKDLNKLINETDLSEFVPEKI